MAKNSKNGARGRNAGRVAGGRRLKFQASASFLTSRDVAEELTAAWGKGRAGENTGVGCK